MDNQRPQAMQRIYLFLFTLILTPILFAQDPFGGGFGAKIETTAKITPEATAVEPGDYFRVAFTLDLKSKYHVYYKNAGAAGFPPAVAWELPEGFTAGELQFPIPHVITSSEGVVSYGYEGKVTFMAQVEASEDLEKGEAFTVKGSFSWLECDVQCEPGDQDFSFVIEAGEETVFVESASKLFDAAEKKLPRYSDNVAGVAKENDGKILLDLSYNSALGVEGPVYFFSSDGQVDSQVAQSVELNEKGDGLVLTLARNTGNDELLIDAAPVGETLAGMLTFETGDGPAAAEIVAELETDADLEAVGKEAAFIAATDDQIKAGLAVYDVDAKPEYVLLGGEREKSLTLLSSLPLVFLGGLILNLMPCVFPVLGLKVMSFVSMAGEDEGKIKNHGLVFGLGVLVTMWILAAFIIALNLNWGQQLSNPVFLASIIILLTSMTGVGGELQSKKGYSGSFFSGALTTLIATPCSGPFLGLVIGFALSQGKVSAMIIFTVFALGIAAPYILLSFFPALIKKLPRPGAWMESFKQIMSFLVFATVVFFLGSYLKLVGSGAFQAFLFALTFIATAAYIYGRWGTVATPEKKRRIVGYGVAAIIGFGGLAFAYSTAKKTEETVNDAVKVGELAWNEWYPGVVELTRKKKRVVWVDYTADW